MMIEQKTKKKRPVDGILLLDKSVGLSSNAALQRVKHLYFAQKAGHTGSLDPLASGMLPICLGQATKFSQYLLSADKTYVVEARLGVRTETGDVEGAIVSEREVPSYSLRKLDLELEQFRGEIQQVPSMYSALKYQGQPLYKLARQGLVVERPARTVKIYALTVAEFSQNILSFTVHCSKGTYIRTLVDDFGEHLGCGAHVISLRRTSVGEFSQNAMKAFDHLAALSLQERDSLLLPLETAVSHLPHVAITDDMAYYFCKGQAIMISQAPHEGTVVVTTKSKKLIGIGEFLEAGLVTPRRLLNQNHSQG